MINFAKGRSTSRSTSHILTLPKFQTLAKFVIGKVHTVKLSINIPKGEN